MQAKLLKIKTILVIVLSTANILSASILLNPQPAPITYGIEFSCLSSSNITYEKKCLNLNSAWIRLKTNNDNSYQAMVEINPLAPLSYQYQHSANKSDTQMIKDSPLLAISNFYIKWRPSTRLNLNMGLYNGSALLINPSKLTTIGTLYSPGWLQLAVNINITLLKKEKLQLSLTVGKGEGNFSNNNSNQKYYGLQLSSQILSATKILIGYSTNPNSTNSIEYSWLKKRYQPCWPTYNNNAKTGYQAQRLAANIIMDGSWLQAYGFTASLGWQQTQLTDIDQNIDTYPFATSFTSTVSCKPPKNNYFFEDPTHNSKNKMIQNTIMTTLSYKILDTYTLALGAESNHTTSKVAVFTSCKRQNKNICAPTLNPQHSSTQQGYSIGLGYTSTQDMSIMLEYSSEKYDHLYEQLNYQNAHTISAINHFISLQLSYSWS